MQDRRQNAKVAKDFFSWPVKKRLIENHDPIPKHYRCLRQRTNHPAIVKSHRRSLETKIVHFPRQRQTTLVKIQFNTDNVFGSSRDTLTDIPANIRSSPLPKCRISVDLHGSTMLFYPPDEGAKFEPRLNILRESLKFLSPSSPSGRSLWCRRPRWWRSRLA